MSKHVVPFLFCLTISLVVFSGLARATFSGEEGISITPVKFRFEVRQGQTIESEIKLKNISSRPIKAELYMAPFGVTGEDYSQVFEKLPGWKSAEDWIKFSENVVDLAPQESKSVKFKADVDEHAAAGGHYATIFAQIKNETGQDNSLMRVKRVGALVYFSVGGSLTRGGLVESFSQFFWLRDNKINLTARLKNTGNVHIDSKAWATTRNIFGKKVSEFSASAVLFPGTIRKIELVKNSNMAPGIYFLQKGATIGDNQYNAPTQLFIAATLIQLCVFVIISISLTCLVIFCIKKRHSRKHQVNRSQA